MTDVGSEGASPSSGGRRGGTTLLQRVLNSYDDVAVYGEHEGVLTPIATPTSAAPRAQLFGDVRAARVRSEARLAG